MHLYILLYFVCLLLIVIDNILGTVVLWLSSYTISTLVCYFPLLSLDARARTETKLFKRKRWNGQRVVYFGSQRFFFAPCFWPTAQTCWCWYISTTKIAMRNRTINMGLLGILRHMLRFKFETIFLTLTKGQRRSKEKTEGGRQGGKATSC